MKRIQVMLTTLVVVLLTVMIVWRQAIATPNIGLPQEARTELQQALQH